MALVKSKPAPQSPAKKRRGQGSDEPRLSSADSDTAILDPVQEIAQPDPPLDDSELYDLALADIEEELPATRRAGARRLGQYPNRSSELASGYAAALLNRLPREEYVSVREVILASLIRLADPVVVAKLGECLRSDDASLRNETIEALKQLPEELAPGMRPLLRDPDPDVRILAVNVLESLKHPEVESWLIEVVETDAHRNVCATAIDLLAEVGTEAAREPLHRVGTRFPNAPYLQFAVQVALARIGGG